MRFLFLFLDGVGLGVDDPHSNPFAKAHMPVMSNLLGGKRLLASSAPMVNQRASLVALDACLGVSGLPQSATGQAALLTGRNVPASIGRHYGPKPNREVSEVVRDGNLFTRLKKAGKRVAFLNAYPPSYFEAIQSGRRIYATIPMAAVYAGLPLRTIGDLHAGRAISADFTAQGWRTHLGLTKTPVLSPHQAGVHLVELSQEYDFALFEYWLSDYVGHGQEMESACRLLETIDGVLAGLQSVWQDETGLILITSDHGNMEDLSTRRHTTNPVPAVLIGASRMRQEFISELNNLTDVASAIWRFLI